tara:strand:- start:157 stop:321 length:165 start_codon:yes stop_codon:yes gene_type:complete
MQKLALWIVGFLISEMMVTFGNQRPNFNSHILEFYKKRIKRGKVVISFDKTVSE